MNIWILGRIYLIYFFTKTIFYRGSRLVRYHTEATDSFLRVTLGGDLSRRNIVRIDGFWGGKEFVEDLWHALKAFKVTRTTSEQWWPQIVLELIIKNILSGCCLKILFAWKTLNPQVVHVKKTQASTPSNFVATIAGHASGYVLLMIQGWPNTSTQTLGNKQPIGTRPIAEHLYNNSLFVLPINLDTCLFSLVIIHEPPKVGYCWRVAGHIQTFTVVHNSRMVTMELLGAVKYLWIQSVKLFFCS